MANLAALLDKEAGAEIESILSEARQRASEIVAEAEKEAEATLAQRNRTLASQHEAAGVRARSSAQLEASSMRLRAQHEAVEDVFDKVQKDVDALMGDEKRYAPVFKSLLEEAAEAVGKDKVSDVTVNPKDEKLAKSALKDLSINAPVHTDESVRGGVRLRATGSNSTVENTLPVRLEALRDELASEVSGVLFKNAPAQTQGS